MSVVDVSLSFSDLDMAPYCSSTPETDSNDAPRARYDLFGIVNHRGTAGYGHYTSYARLLGHNDSAKTELGTSENEDWIDDASLRSIQVGGISTINA